MDHPKTQTSFSLSTIILVALIVLPLGVIGFQLFFHLSESWGQFGYSFYKIFFLIPPLIYCRMMGIDLLKEIFILKNWRRYLPVAVGLGVLALLIFWVAYFSLRELLQIDEDLILRSTAEQFGVTKHNILYIAPLTIFFNSMLEEFFHLGF